jgi:transposase
MAVAWGLEHRDLSGITAIGTDEICWRKRKDKFVTLVYQLDQGKRRLLWIGPDRTAKTFQGFFDWLGPEGAAIAVYLQRHVETVSGRHCRKGSGCRQCPRPVSYHESHEQGHRRGQGERGQRVEKQGKRTSLDKSRWCLLKRPENLTEKQVDRLKDLLACNLRTVRAYLLKEDFQRFWTYSSPAWAGKFLDAWCTRTMRSKIKPMKKVAKMLRAHRALLLNWFRAKGAIALGCVEGFNNKAKVVTKRSYGFRTYDGLKIALYHALGDLPTPKATHRFC